MTSTRLRRPRRPPKSRQRTISPAGARRRRWRRGRRRRARRAPRSPPCASRASCVTCVPRRTSASRRSGITSPWLHSTAPSGSVDEQRERSSVERGALGEPRLGDDLEPRAAAERLERLHAADVRARPEPADRLAGEAVGDRRRPGADRPCVSGRCVSSSPSQSCRLPALAWRTTKMLRRRGASPVSRVWRAVHCAHDERPQRPPRRCRRRPRAIITAWPST